MGCRPPAPSLGRAGPVHGLQVQGWAGPLKAVREQRPWVPPVSARTLLTLSPLMGLVGHAAADGWPRLLHGFREVSVSHGDKPGRLSAGTRSSRGGVEDWTAWSGGGQEGSQGLFARPRSGIFLCWFFCRLINVAALDGAFLGAYLDV